MKQIKKNARRREGNTTTQNACDCKQALKPKRDDHYTGTCQRCGGWTPMFQGMRYAHA